MCSICNSTNCRDSSRLQNVALVALLCFSLIGIGYWLLCVGLKTTSDKAMRREFHENSESFLELRDMIMSEPALRGVGEAYLRVTKNRNEYSTRSFWTERPGWTTNGSGGPHGFTSTKETLELVGISEARYGEYNKLLSSINAKRIDWSGMGSSHHVVDISIYARGNVVSSVEKHIVFFPDGISEYYVIKDNTDEIHDEARWYSQ